MQEDEARLRAYIISGMQDQELPILFIVGNSPNKALTLIRDKLNDYGRNLRVHCKTKIPGFSSLVRYKTNGKVLIIYGPSLESIIKLSNIKTEKEIDYIVLNSLVINIDSEGFEVPRKYEFRKNTLPKEKVKALPFSKNLKSYFEVFRGIEYFVNSLYKMPEEKTDTDWPVHIWNNQYIISRNLFVERFYSIFGMYCPFSELEVRRWIFERSIPTNIRMRNSAGPKYRVFKAWEPVC